MGNRLGHTRGQRGRRADTRSVGGFSGLSDSYIALVEQAATGVSIASLVQMASVLKVSAWELMRRIEEEMERGPRSPIRSPGRPRKKADSKS